MKLGKSLVDFDLYNVLRIEKKVQERFQNLITKMLNLWDDLPKLHTLACNDTDRMKVSICQVFQANTST